MQPVEVGDTVWRIAGRYPEALVVEAVGPKTIATTMNGAWRQSHRRAPQDDTGLVATSSYYRIFTTPEQALADAVALATAAVADATERLNTATQARDSWNPGNR